MVGRSFRLRVGDSLSEAKDPNVGCIQGSILDPKLFSIHCRKAVNSINTDAKIIMYADDSYVINTSTSYNGLKDKTETSMNLHVSFLRSIGMVVNASKTELLFSSRRKLDTTHLVINCNGAEIISKK